MFESVSAQRPFSRRTKVLGFTLALMAAASAAFTAQDSDPARPGALETVRPTVRDFVEIPGVREFSSRLIVRPLQPSALLSRGLSTKQVESSRAEARRQVSRYDVQRYVAQTDEYIITTPPGTTELQVAWDLLETGNFEYAEPDWVVFPFACSDDPLLPQQWHHQADRMQSCDGWNLHTGSPAVSVGICDTGVLTTHEDLQMHRLKGYNAVDRLWESQGGQIGPVHPHGTMTTGTAAANGNNGIGVVGVGWNLSHRMLRVTNNPSGGAWLSVLQHAARTSIESGDRVASVSYSGVSSISNGTTATYIKSIGGLLVWSAGNSMWYMGHADRDADDLIVTGATDSTDSLAFFSNWGPFVDLVAPGVGVLTSSSGHDADYRPVSGTSFSCPLTAGLCALIWSMDPTLTPDEVESILKQGVDDIGTPGLDDVFGYGRINVFQSLLLLTDSPPVADFSAMPTVGLSPLTVAFMDQSAGVRTSWSWDFGDGSTSTLQHPSHTYTASGVYTVTLTVANAFGSDTTTRVDDIWVDIAPPVASFTGLPTSGLSPMIVDFTNLSTGSTSWSWDFGDGSTSTLQHPSHTYTTSGFYTVTLTASSAYGSDTLALVDYITVDNIPPIAGFSGTPSSGEAPLVVAFTDQSTGGAVAEWYWEFGDGGTSTLQHPTYTYTSPGRYRVMLVVINDFGADALWRADYVEVAPGPPLTADFSGSPTSGTAPLTVAFSDLSSDAPISWSWDFGDGGSSAEQNPSHTYTKPGAFKVTLTATNADGSDTAIKEEYVMVAEGGGGNPPTADFSGTPTLGSAPLTVAFTDLSSGTPTSWSWDFGDGGTSTARDPGHTYATAGVYSVSLTATNADGSDARVRMGYITVTDAGGSPPVADFSGTPTLGSAPLTVAFTDLSSGAPTSWSWDFGDGGTSTARNPGHTYATAGVYSVSLTVTNVDGSDTLTRVDYITVDGGGGTGPPVADFAGSPTSGMAPLTVGFTDLSSGSPTSWSWLFGDDGKSTAQNPTHTYTKPGDYKVILTVTNADGSDTLVREKYIIVPEGG